MIRIRLATVKNFNFKWFLLKSLAVLVVACVCVHTSKHAQLPLILCDPMDCTSPVSQRSMDSPGTNTGVGCHFLFQGIFPTWVLYELSHLI